MKAIILAAGIGSRLRPLTNSKPKTLVNVNNKPILGHILEALRLNGISEVIILIGYKGIDIVNYCELNFPDLNITFIENNLYDTTNNMYSLYLAKNHLNGDIILMNADLVFNPGIITALMRQTTFAVAVDKGRYIEESMKIIVDSNKISSISKGISEADSYGSSIDIYRLTPSDNRLIKDELTRIIELEKDRNQWTEVMLNNLFQLGKLSAKPLDIRRKPWVEIDNLQDLNEAEVIFNKQVSKLKRKKIFFIDRDGTLTLGDKKLDGADTFLKALENKGKKFFIVTNNSSKTPKEHLQTLKRISSTLSLSNLLLSTDIACSHLINKGFTNVYWLANGRVSEYLLSKRFIFDRKKPSALLLTYDDEIDYKKLVDFCRFVQMGVPYFATHTDVCCPTVRGPIPDIGTFIEVVKSTTGREPNLTFGKPGKEMIDKTLKKYGLKYEDAVIIGDRLYTDIKMAEDLSITSVLVLTGETKRDVYEENEIKADIVVDSLANLIDYL